MRRLVLTMLFPLVLLVGGTGGYMVLEGWEFFDAFYMTVITLATVGYREVHPLSQTGQIFTVALILGGVFTLLYAASTVIHAIVSGDLGRIIGRRRMERKMAELRDHVIVCGYGRMGQKVCDELALVKLPYAVIERSTEPLESFDATRGISVHGDATSDAVLRRAGIDRARALVTVLGSDSDNLFVTMSARLLNEKLRVIARAEDEESEAKLMRAGASRVFSPYAVTGYRVAQSVIRPDVVDFIEVATGAQHLELQIEELRLAPASNLTRKSIADSKLRQDYGVMVLAVKKQSGRVVYSPPGDLVMEPNDVLIVVGDPKELTKLEAAVRGA